MLSSVPTCKNAGMSLLEETHVSDELRSGTCHSAGGLEFNVTESAIRIK